MADSELVSSTTQLEEELSKLHDHRKDDLNEAIAKDVVNVEDIVDLVGGAQDAIDRHMATSSPPEVIPQEFTEISSTPNHEPMLLTEPEPVVVPEPVVIPEPVVEPEPVVIPEPVVVPEPEIAPPTTVVEDATEQLIKEAIPDSTVAEEEPEEVAHIVPPAEPVYTEAVPEPEPEPVPEPAPAPAPEPVLAPVEPPKAVPEEVLLPREEAAAPPPPASLVELLYWRDVKTTGVVFGASLLLLLSLTVCSIVSVCSYVGLALLSVTISFRIYKGILQAIQKSDEGHPFKLYLDQEVALSEDVVHTYSDVALARINKTVGDLRRLFLVEDLIDSLKFAVLMWILTYVGALFNGLTLIILGLVGAFSGPIIYEKHQTQIDHYLALVNNQIKDIVAKIQAKVPGLKRKAE